MKIAYWISLSVFFSASVWAQAEDEQRPVTYIAPMLAVSAPPSGLKVQTTMTISVPGSAPPSSLSVEYFNSQGEEIGLSDLDLSTGVEAPFSFPVSYGLFMTVSPGVVRSYVLSNHRRATELEVGWIRLEGYEFWSDTTESWRPVNQFVVGYQYLDADNGDSLISSVDTEVSRPSMAWQFPILELREGGSEQKTTSIAFAVANPNSESVTVQVRTISNYRSLGDWGVSRSFTLEPRCQLSMFVHELFADDPAWEGEIEDGRLVSQVEVEASLPIGLTALRTDQSQSHGFIVSGWRAVAEQR